ncbi:hemolysin family protein [Saccharopolyspora gloriosae]|uniref:hemolysin family protein n=1 Tax=Saccharopolyspora gloriosae TaxID=455344 RepID=UPI001FB6ED9E|nr:hemolysin family protein [Saccharopolyspora gloriosae]
MGGIAGNLALVLLFVLIGGFFAAAEIALVALREGQVHKLAEQGRRGRRVAALRADSNRFLSAVQIGVTFAGFFASSYGGATIAVRLQPALAGWGLPVGIAATLALIVVTALVSYLSLVFGELVPKRLALQRPEGVALLTAGFLDRLATVARPMIWLLSKSTDGVVRLLGFNPQAGEGKVTQDELRDMVRTNEQLSLEERQLLTDAFQATDRVLSEVMVPRTEVDFLPSTVRLADAVNEVGDKPHSRYPVIGDSADEVVGFIHVRDLLRHDSHGRSTVRELARPVVALPRSKPVLAALSGMRQHGNHLAIVVDEYGGTDGIVTIEDLVEEIVGDIWDEYDPSATPVAARADGTYDIDGLTHHDAVQEQTGIALPDGPYDTVAGFVISRFQRVPAEGESIDALDHRFTVREMDGRRIARLHITPLDTSGGDDR